ncbi:hypothetical protein HEP86_39615 [Streptomyces sp. RPA4-5]|uniref:hypothetical protein n=1 Tax=Streptomyces sp. RPA4-5 TaxID=2721245 RepID=UPI00143EAD0D|nr:hypothetical protein [Streptomyces sp. RPA4-5]QIY59437.1 hypothetical protein HEP86_39615 [Streptomyces sp. RPA4-5]
MEGNMSGPVRHETKFYACYSQYWMIGTLDSDDEVPEPEDVSAERRVDVTHKGRAAKVETHAQHGDVNLVFEFHEQEPAWAPGEWQEVVENSMRLANEVFLLNMDEESGTIPVPGEPVELAWWRVRLHVRLERDAAGVHPVGHDEVRETHVVQLWPAAKSDSEILVQATEKVGDVWEELGIVALESIGFDEPSESLVLHLGDSVPEFTGEGVQVSADGRGVRVLTSGWGEKDLRGVGVSFNRSFPPEASGWEKEAEVTLTGPGQVLRMLPNSDSEWAAELPLPEGESEPWHVVVYARGRNPEREEGEYHVTVWPEGR